MGEEYLYKIEDRVNPDQLSLEEACSQIDQGIVATLQHMSLQGKKVGVLCGSRGIRNIGGLVKQTVKTLKRLGAEVAILPAMGSHGGATAEGQKALLAGYGITEENCEAPVLSTMDVEQIGEVAGHPVYADRIALTLDGIVPVNRVKAHTDYHGDHESGIVKMIAIGMGKRAQAEAIHRHGVAGLKKLLAPVAKVAIQKVPLLAAVAIVENKFDEAALVEVLTSENLFSREQELLAISKTLLPQVPFTNLDVMVVGEMGKDISGVGMDPNVTRRMRIGGEEEDPLGPRRIVVLNLTEASGGNALGMGIADVISRRLYQKIDFTKTYVNTITSGFLERCFVPLVMDSDREAVMVALQTCGRAVDWQDGRLVFLRNTLAVQQMYISASLLPEVPSSFDVAPEKITPIFSADGDLLLW